MNKEQFIKYLEKPGLLNADSLPLLEKTVSGFPYFQTARLLYLKNLQKEKNIHYSTELKVTAAYAADRKQLYHFIMQEQLAEQITKIEKELNKEVPAKAEKTMAPAPHANLKATANSPAAAPADKVADNDKPKEKTPPVRAKEISALEQEILKEAISSSIEKEVMEEAKTQGSSAKAKEEDKISSAAPEEATGSGYSFTDWLKQSVPAGGAKEEKEADKPSAGAKKPSKTDLIEKFIKEEPRITPKKAEFFSPVNMARLSAVENEDFVTETLAKVYAKQGSITKAINAYEKLSLKFPEKKRYFAALIQELKDKSK